MMETSDRIEAYFEKDHPFKEGIAILRYLALKTEAVETVKWGSPVYTVNGKNVFWIARFKNHFGLGFFNGALLKDEKKVLINAQEDKTRAMRHWKFHSIKNMDSTGIASYMDEAIENQKKSLKPVPRKKKSKKTAIPDLLNEALEKNPRTKSAFEALAPYKQREYSEYIDTAKQEKTKLNRLKKILPIINEGMGLNDKYRNC